MPPYLARRADDSGSIGPRLATKYCQRRLRVRSVELVPFATRPLYSPTEDVKEGTPQTDAEFHFRTYAPQQSDSSPTALDQTISAKCRDAESGLLGISGASQIGVVMHDSPWDGHEAGLTSKIHAVVDTNGLPVRLARTTGEAHDNNRLARTLLSRLKSGTMLLADRGYDADWIRALVRPHGAWANIPPKRNRTETLCFSPYLYRARNLVERFSTRSSTAGVWQRATTRSRPTTSHSSSLRPYAYGCTLMSPRPRVIRIHTRAESSVSTASSVRDNDRATTTFDREA
jgi:transposase